MEIPGDQELRAKVVSAFSHVLSSNTEILSKGESRAGKLLHPLCLKKALCKCAFGVRFPASLTILIIMLITAQSLGEDSEARSHLASDTDNELLPRGVLPPQLKCVRQTEAAPVECRRWGWRRSRSRQASSAERHSAEPTHSRWGGGSSKLFFSEGASEGMGVSSTEGPLGDRCCAGCLPT